jgi:hypothetical protein
MQGAIPIGLPLPSQDPFFRTLLVGRQAGKAPAEPNKLHAPAMVPRHLGGSVPSIPVRELPREGLKKGGSLTLLLQIQLMRSGLILAWPKFSGTMRNDKRDRESELQGCHVSMPW